MLMLLVSQMLPFDGWTIRDWEDKVLARIFVNITTGLIAFLVALAFSPVRAWLFSSNIKEYPLLCTAEPYADAEHKGLLFVDFFIINKDGNEYSRQDLLSLLRNADSDTSVSRSPDIALHYSRSFGKIERVDMNDNFNESKGRVTAKVVDPMKNAISIKIEEISARAVIKITIIISGLPSITPEGIKRVAKGVVPFDIEQYHGRCYTQVLKAL